MAPFDHHNNTPPYDGGGFQAPQNWVYPSNISPLPYMNSYSPASYVQPCYGYEPRDHQECVHARLLCDQRYADLRAWVADLERLQCRCGRSTWSRLTRSIIGSLKSAASRVQRRKSHDSSGSSALTESEDLFTKGHHEAAQFNPGPIELYSHPCFELCSKWQPPFELNSGAFQRHELYSGYPLRSELAGASHRNDPYPDYQTHACNVNNFDYNLPELDDSSAPQKEVLRERQYQDPFAAETNVSIPFRHTQTCSQCPSDSVVAARVNSDSATPIITRQRGHSIVSPLSPFSTNSSGSHTDVSPITTPGEQVFAPHATSSPVEFRNSDAAWNARKVALQQSSQNSLSERVELPGSPAKSLREGVSLLTEQASAPVFKSSDLMRAEEPVLPQAVQSVSDFSQSQHYPYDSKVKTMFDAYVDSQPVSTEFNSPSQQRHEAVPVLQCQSPASPAASLPQGRDPKKRAELSGREQNSAPLRCDLCHYVAGGKEPRRMMIRHCMSKRHREKMGQEPLRFTCPVCGSAHVRPDNLRQHVIKKHEKKDLALLWRGACRERRLRKNGRRGRGAGAGMEATRRQVYNPLRSQLAVIAPS